MGRGWGCGWLSVCSSPCPPPLSASAPDPAATSGNPEHSAATTQAVTLEVRKLQPIRAGFEDGETWVHCIHVISFELELGNGTCDAGVCYSHLLLSKGSPSTAPETPGWEPADQGGNVVTQCRTYRERQLLRERRACVCLVFTVSLVSPSLMRKMSRAASRFLSRLQSSFSETKPLRSSFSTY